MKNYIIIICILIFGVEHVTAISNDEYFFSELGVRNGLSQSSVFCIFQDSDGYMWFGTRNGVNKYDGNKITVLRHEVNNLNTLTDNYITSIEEDGRKNIWIGTANGINCLEYSTNQITRFHPRDISPSINSDYIKYLVKHTDGTVYAFNSEEIFRCKEDRSIEHIILKEKIDSRICAVDCDSFGHIYITYEDNSLYIFDSNWELKNSISFKEYLPEEFLHFQISVIFSRKEPYVIIGTENNGLYIYNKKNREVLSLNTENSNINNNTIRALAFTKNGDLLVGTFAGLNLLNLNDLTIRPIKSPLRVEGGLGHYSIHSLLNDKDNTIWVGTYATGVNYYSPYMRPSSFILPDRFNGLINNGVEDKNGDMWFATEGRGLMSYNPVDQQTKFYPLDSSSPLNYEKNIIKTILTKGDFLYCTTHFGEVYRFSIINKEFHKLYEFANSTIPTLYIDSKDRLWIPGNNPDYGLCMINEKKQTFSFPVDNGYRKFHSIRVIHEIEPDIFLFGSSEDSLYLYNMQNSTLKNIASRLGPFGKHERLGAISAIIQDNDDYWIGATQSGVYRLDKNLNLVKHYQGTDGLQASYVSSIVLDQKRNIWVATGSNIYKLDRVEDKFNLHNIPGIRSQEFSIHGGSVALDGTVYFPGNRGIYFFKPQSRRINPIIPPVYITGILTSFQDQEKELIPEKIQIAPYQYKYTIKLSHKQNNLVIRYCALNYIHPRENKFAFRMNNLNSEWIYVGNRREAYFNKLPPGKYLFRVKGANNDNQWNPQETQLEIIISPPFYKSKIAYAFYLFVFLLSVYKINRYHNDKKELEREVRYKQLEHDKMHELHQERIRMYANFSHELRVPLTLIINPVNELIEESSFSPEVKRRLDLIKKHAGRMLLLVNNLMDIQKYEAGKPILVKNKFDFSTFMHEIYHSFEGIAGKQRIKFHLKNELPDNYCVRYDEIEIEKVFFNLLSNAFKFTPAGGEVNIYICSQTQEECRKLPFIPESICSMLCEQKYVFIKVKDNGNGFSDDEAEKIFSPFFRLEKDIQSGVEGTGIGLSLTRSIIIQHEGFIWVEGNKHQGAVFYILLPDNEPQEDITLPIEMEAGSSSNKIQEIIQEAESTTKKTILIVDDNREILTFLERQLLEDYTVIKVYNGKEALTIVRERKVDIVISDIMMPELNGIELCKRIKEDTRTGHIPVILVTAKSMIHEIKEGLDAGADDYIIKPFDISVLKARMKNILTHREKMKTVYGEMYSLKILYPEENNENKDFLMQYIEIVKANISDPDFDVSVIYETLGMSRANFYRKVKSTSGGISPMELVKNIRLEAAAKLLKDSHLNITEIALQTGFGNRSNFSKSFKAVYGMSPAIFRRSIRIELPKKD